MIRKEEVYCIGRIGKPHGVHGELSMHVDDDVFDRIDADYLVIDRDGILVPFFIEAYRFRSEETVLISFEGIDTQEKAAELTGSRVFFPRHLADEDQSLTRAAIIGYQLKDSQTGCLVGTIRAVDDSTANLLLEVEGPEGEERLIPLHEELVRDIDQKNQTITLEIPEGLLEL